MKISTLVLAALSLAPLARSQSFESSVERNIQPFILEDSFAGVGACGVLDVKSIRAWNLNEAADLARPCFEAVGEKYQAELVLQAGFLSAAQAGRPARTGLILKTDLIPGSKYHRDLAASIARRHGLILGHPILLLTRGEAAPSAVSSIQDALSGCILMAVVRDIRTSDDFVRIYGKCLTRNPDLKISEIRPLEGMTVALKTGQSAKDVEALNGFVTVNAGMGPVQLMVVAYAAQVALP